MLEFLSVDGMNLFQMIVWIFIYSFLGWAMECVVIRRERGYWENRGFAKLPFCIIYGLAIFAAFHIFKPIQDNMILLYFVGAISATAVEYLTGIMMMKLFGELWWDYTNKKFNYKGILCLESTIGWGFVALFVFGFLNIRVESLIMSMPERVVMYLSILLAGAYSVDFVYHFVYSILHKDDEVVEGKSNTTHMRRA